MGGEKRFRGGSLQSQEGSPPHRRGKSVPIAAVPIAAGITPAWAGKRYYVDPQVGVNRDHPRAGGEKLSNSTRNRSIMGLPPHRRGKDAERAEVRAEMGITPRVGGEKRNPHS